jgi:hypothetical protein
LGHAGSRAVQAAANGTGMRNEKPPVSGRFGGWRDPDSNRGHHDFQASVPATCSGPKVLHRARIDALRTAARCSLFAEAQRRFGTQPAIRVPIASVDCRRKHLMTCRSVRPAGRGARARSARPRRSPTLSGALPGAPVVLPHRDRAVAQLRPSRRAVPIRPTQQRAGAPRGAPGLFLCREACVCLAPRSWSSSGARTRPAATLAPARRGKAGAASFRFRR